MATQTVDDNDSIRQAFTKKDQDDAALDQRITDHEADKNNPHGVTPAQIGAASLDTDGKILPDQARVQSVNGKTGTVVLGAQDVEAAPAVLADTSQGAAQRFMEKAHLNQEDLSLLVVTDSTGSNVSPPWPRMLCDTLAAAFPTHTITYRLWDDASTAYGAPTAVQTGTGAHKIDVYNGSQPGATPAYFLGSRLDATMIEPAPDLVLISHGHNGADGDNSNMDKFSGLYKSLTETVGVIHPGAEVVCVIQNPKTTNSYQALRAAEIQKIAAARGFGVVNVHDLFADMDDFSAYMEADGIHPNTPGHQLYASEIAKMFQRRSEGGARVQVPSSLLSSTENLLPNGDFSRWSGGLPEGWSAYGPAVVAKGTQMERSASTVRLRASSAAGTLGISYALSRRALNRARGRMVTLAARAYVPSSAAGAYPRIYFTAGGHTYTSVAIGSTDGWVWAVVSGRIPYGASSVTVYLEGGANSAASDVTFDRVSLVPGFMPHDTPRPQPQSYRELLEANLDALLSGTLYTFSQPFTQSWTFSGDGTTTTFKITRDSVNQRGWVRGGVSATVGGVAATGTWDMHTQTFTFASAPAAGAGNVVITATDVVPYQGMGGTNADTLTLLYASPLLGVTTSGTGVATSHTHKYFPLTPKLPIGNPAHDDAMVHAAITAPGLSSNTSLLYMPVGTRVYDEGYYQPIPVGTDIKPSANATNAAIRRGALGFYAAFWGQLLSVSIAHVNFMALLFRVKSPAPGSVFEEGELVLGIMSRYDNLNWGAADLTATSGSASFDLFRLDPQVIEA